MRSIYKNNKRVAVMLACLLGCLSLFAAGSALSAAPPFDHATTGFLLRDVHATLRCEQCHVDGIFKNTPQDCAGCHAVGSRVGATPKPVNHVRTNSPCDTCHSSPSNFLVKSFKHIGVTGDCAACHNGQSAGVTSKPAGHFPTLQPCETCHTNTATFISWRMNHIGITSNCAFCHSGQFPAVVRKPAAHIATTAPCESCHSSTTDFAEATFSHATVPVAGVCNSCHLGQFPGVTAQPANHIPTAGAQCDVCHTTANTSGYTSFIGATYNHASGVPPLSAGNCSSCHTGQRPGVPGKAANHIPTTAQCDTCHTASNTRNYLTFQGAPVHTTPPGVCASCHNGVYARGKAPVHIQTTAACDTCHTQTNTANYTSFLGATFVHGTSPGVCANCHNGVSATGKKATHILTSAACDACHTPTNTANYTTFLGAPFVHAQPLAACASCHNGVIATGKSATHIATTAACDACHSQNNTSNFTTFLGATFAHDPPLGVCATCHNGVTATGKSANHIATAAACDVCHSRSNTSGYTTFTGATFVHDAAGGNCASCHNGTVAIGKPAFHIQTQAQCDTCHTQANTANYTTFLGARFVHSSPVGVCTSCHNGQTAKGKSATHIPTTAACDLCHTQSNTANYTSFLGAAFVHLTPPGVCASCHNGITALGKPNTHIYTSAACDTCHTQANTANYTSFLGAVFTHVSPIGVCASCHNGVIATGKPPFHIPTTAACDTCHTQSNTAGYTSFLGATFLHPTPPGVCTTCHDGVTARTKSAQHIPTTAACDTCHTQSNTANYTTFLGATFAHAAPVGVCASCHNGIFATGKSAVHVATTAACDVCHTRTNTSNFTTFTGAQFVHISPIGVCASCHNGVIAPGKTPTHVATAAACDLCHTQSNTANYTSFLGAAFVHTAPVGVCSSCHNGVTALGKSATHILTTGACDACHTQTNTANYTTFRGAIFAHISPIGVCASCHNGVIATGKPVFHIATTAACNTCHTQAITANYTTFLGAAFVHPTPVGVCATCHDGVTAKGKSAQHLPTTAACDACHTQSNTANYTTFLGATFAHTAPVGVCANCHNGVFATGKSAVHVATTAACNTCHTQSNTANYTTFLGATFVHISPIGVCASCHNSVIAPGKPTIHVATTAACDLCHTQSNTANYTSFLGAVFTHATPPGVCASCHNGVIALGKSSGHMVTASACDSCHTQSNTANYTTFTGASGSVDHSAIPAGNCQSCHNGSTAKGLSAGHIPSGTRTCDGCHAKFNGTTVTTFSPATMNHAVVTAVRCDTCHGGAYTTQGVQYGGAKAKVTRHIPTTITGGLDCNTCHTNPVYTSASGWSPVRMNHNGAQGGGVPVYCVTCHLSGTTYQGGMQKKSHEGTSTAKDCSRSGCHRPLGSKGAAYTRWD